MEQSGSTLKVYWTNARVEEFTQSILDMEKAHKSQRDFFSALFVAGIVSWTASSLNPDRFGSIACFSSLAVVGVLGLIYTNQNPRL